MTFFKKGISFAFVLVLCSELQAQNWDINLLKAINPQNPSSGYWRGTTNSAFFISIGAPAGLLVSALITKDPQQLNQSLEVFGALAIDLALTEGVKVIVNRPRPAETYPNDIHPYQNEMGLSFPSGHTSFAFAAAAAMSIQFHKWYITLPAYLWAASVGYSRMYLGVHYPTDVIAGAAVGIGSAYLAHWINAKWFKKKTKGKQVAIRI